MGAGKGRQPLRPAQHRQQQVGRAIVAHLDRRLRQLAHGHAPPLAVLLHHRGMIENVVLPERNLPVQPELPRIRPHQHGSGQRRLERRTERKPLVPVEPQQQRPLAVDQRNAQPPARLFLDGPGIAHICQRRLRHQIARRWRQQRIEPPGRHRLLGLLLIGSPSGRPSRYQHWHQHRGQRGKG